MDLGGLALRDVAAVVAVAEHGHFGRAAESLRIAQPTLSAQVAKAERVLGATLFERTGRSFLISPAGERALPLMRELLAVAQRLHDAAGGGARDQAGRQPFRLGVIPTLGPYLMPHLLPGLRSSASVPSVEIVEAPTARLVESLRDGGLDAALLSLPLRHEALSAIPLFDEPFRLLAPKRSPLLSLPRLSPGRLRASEMVLLEEGHCLRDQALSVCGRRGGSTPRLVTTSLETLKYLVASTGDGYSLLPALACELPGGLGELLGVRAFDERPPSRRIALCLRRTSPRRELAHALAALIRTLAPDAVRVVR
jgi:LysR family hydrogen peroxide-inducible transcriptional activator